MTKQEQTALVVAVALFLLSRRGEGAFLSPHVTHTGTEHEAKSTPLTTVRARGILYDTFRSFIMREPSSEEMALLLAHSALETGRWKKMSGNNWGFVTTDGGLDWFMLPGNPLKFRWYDRPEVGCEDWLRQLVENWSDAWGLIGSGQPEAYAQALAHGRFGSYYGDADPATYGHTLRLLYNEFLIAEQNAAFTPKGRPAKRVLAPPRARR